MTKTQRLLTALAVAAGASALSAPVAGAAIVPAPTGPQGPSLLNRVDNLSKIAVAPEHRSELPTVTEQFGGLDGLQRLGEARQLIEPVAPVLWLLPLG
ncbi:hypothetical protein AB0J57_07945 [Streptomyces sp. NPDC049837]|uniref:hypothetical protein n=1 Tax=Streptomyces sp. NPDC049837 TaxID=3155277 RepID=UPI003425CC12